MMSLKNYDVTGVKTFHILNFNLISTILSLIFKALPRTLIIEARNEASRSSDNSSDILLPIHKRPDSSQFYIFRTLDTIVLPQNILFKDSVYFNRKSKMVVEL